MIRVAVKFCGGCDPDYDRASYFERIKAAAGSRIEWVRFDAPDYDHLLVISGCPTACPAESIRAEGITDFLEIHAGDRPPEQVVAVFLGEAS